MTKELFTHGLKFRHQGSRFISEAEVSPWQQAVSGWKECPWSPSCNESLTPPTHVNGNTMRPIPSRPAAESPSRAKEGWSGWGTHNSGEQAPIARTWDSGEEMNGEGETGVQGSVSRPNFQPPLHAPCPVPTSSQGHFACLSLGVKPTPSYLH